MKKLIVGFILGGLAAIFGSLFTGLVLFVKMLENDAINEGLKNAFVDSVTRFINKYVYEGKPGPVYAGPYRYAPNDRRVQYQRPSSRASSVRPFGHMTEDLIFPSKEAAEQVLYMMKEIIETYEVVTKQDLNNLVGLPSTHRDHLSGWTSLNTAAVGQFEDKWKLHLPDSFKLPKEA